MKCSLFILVAVLVLSQTNALKRPSSAIIPPRQEATYVVFKCEQGGEGLDTLKASISPYWWIELGNKIFAHVGKVENVTSTQCELIANFATSRHIMILQRDHRQETEPISGVDVILRGWGYYIVSTVSPLSVLEGLSTGWREIPFSYINTVLVRSSTRPAQQKPNDVISELVALVDGTRWFSTLTQLATYNRYTRGSGIATAQAWITAQLQAIAGQNSNISIAAQAFPVGTTTAYNIIATIPGYATPDKWVIVGGHYDSTSQSPTSSAPGAEDNASGAAAVLEMVRAFATKPPPATGIFIFFSGEEQGLYGSTYHASQIVSQGNTKKVDLMHNMDMIAYKAASNPDYEVLIETNSQFQGLFPVYTSSAADYTKLKLLYSTNAFGSDHEPYLRRGMPGVLTIDGDWDSYPDYHRTTDTPSKCNAELGTQIVQMGVAVVATHLGY